MCQHVFAAVQILLLGLTPKSRLLTNTKPQATTAPTASITKTLTSIETFSSSLATLKWHFLLPKKTNIY